MCVWSGHYFNSHFTNEKSEAHNAMFLTHHCHFIPGSWQVGVTQGPKINKALNRAPRTPDIPYVQSSVICFNVYHKYIWLKTCLKDSTFCIFLS